MQNIVILAGNIGQAPDVRATQSGTKITSSPLPPRARVCPRVGFSATRTATA